jgi:hypothetical protein
MQIVATAPRANTTVEPPTQSGNNAPVLRPDGYQETAPNTPIAVETEVALVDESGSKVGIGEVGSGRGKKKIAAACIVVLVLVMAFTVAFRFTSGREQRAGTAVRASDSMDLSTTTLAPTTLAPTTTTVPRTTTTFNGRSYCNADGIAELLGNGGFENVPARSWEKYGLFTDDRRIRYTADRMWTLAYTHYGTAPISLPHPWAVDSTPAGWLNCQNGRWVYVADALTFTPLCSSMGPEFQAAFLELSGTTCL